MDDDFIDDGGLDLNQDEMATELLYEGNSSFYPPHNPNKEGEDKEQGEGKEEGEEEDKDN